MKTVISVILGGGQGTRLFPLTKYRSKPAVPIGGKYRLIDIPITNCLRSTINKIFILTQFNSESLNKHIVQTYRFDNFHDGFVNILAAEQTDVTTDWYLGTADAVRKNLKHILSNPDVKYILILSGDQIYKMDYKKLYDCHRANRADLTICVKPVLKEETGAFGIMKVKDNTIFDFIEKPQDQSTLEKFNSRDEIKSHFKKVNEGEEYLASMGIYLFNKKVLLEALENSYTDFAKDIIPNLLKTKKVKPFYFNKYWEDVGSVRTFWQANLDFTLPVPKFNLYEDFIFTHARFLPPSKIVNSVIDQAIISGGSIVQSGTIKRSIIGIRSIIKDNVHIENTLVMGADFYESDADKGYNRRHNIMDVGIGENTIIHNAIIDKNARIGKNCKIVNVDNKENFDGDNYHIREKIVVIPKNSIIPDNTEI